MSVNLSFQSYEASGPVSEPPLVIAHGLFGAGRNWASIAKRLATRRRVFTVDMRNHGDSPHLAQHDYAAMAEDLAAFIITHANGAASVLGHSMGGKAAMQMALTMPRLAEALIVADMAPVAYGHDHSTHLQAMMALDLTGITRRSEADARLQAGIPNPVLRAFLLQNLLIDEAGARWRVNLPAIAANLPIILNWSVPAEVQSDVPALFIYGGASDYVTPATHPAIFGHFPHARLLAVAGAGHWLHAEQPDAVVSVVDQFLTDCFR